MKNIRVVIVEDDPFARNWMALLLSRDLRTRVVVEVDSPYKLHPSAEKMKRVDLILMDIDIAGREDWLAHITELAARSKRFPKILCTGIQGEHSTLQHLNGPVFSGYLLKGEIGYSLAWAVVMAAEGNWVVTPGILTLAASIGFSIPKTSLILDGRYAISDLTEHQANVARLAVLFSMERRDLADELGVSEDWSYGLVSMVYEKLGLKDVLLNGVEPKDYFGDQELVLSYFQRIKDEFSGTGKARDMETMAFHLLTLPEMKRLE